MSVRLKYLFWCLLLRLYSIFGQNMYARETIVKNRSYFGQTIPKKWDLHFYKETASTMLITFVPNIGLTVLLRLQICYNISLGVSLNIWKSSVRISRLTTRENVFFFFNLYETKHKRTSYGWNIIFYYH